MRLRQLATTQSVCFFAFPETHQSILDTCGMNENDEVDSSHVVHWLLEQTCRTNEQLQSLYISQGSDFCSRINAEWKYADFLSTSQDRKAFVKVLKHPEQQTLQELYGGRTEKAHAQSSLRTEFPQLQMFMNKLKQLRLHASNAAKGLHSSALEEVEQEREVEVQVEEVREVQKAHHYKAHLFPGLHAVISDFVSTGRLEGNEGYKHVFDAVSSTPIGQKFGLARTSSSLFVSDEFMKTIVTDNAGLVENFLVS